MELTVLGCSGSYNAPPAGACSGYLLREGETTIWMDCGHGSFTNLQRQMDPGDLTAIVITHEHPDHCVDIYGLHVLLRYALEDSYANAPPLPGLLPQLGWRRGRRRINIRRERVS